MATYDHEPAPGGGCMVLPSSATVACGGIISSIRLSTAGGQRSSATKRGETETRGAAPGRPLSSRPTQQRLRAADDARLGERDSLYPSVRVSLSALA